MKRLALIALLCTGPMVTLWVSVGHAAPPTVASAAESSLEALRLELQKAESAIAALHAQQKQLADDASQLATQIDRAKHRADSVARDRELSSLLARSKSKTDELERVQTELRWREPGLLALRRRVLRAVDIVLDSGRVLPDATRFELERLRATTVALLTSPALPLSIAQGSPNNFDDPLDGPRELREKADLLRDSGDKLRREAKRIAGRLDGVERRRRLRERSGALDEDLFAEATSNRRVARVSESANIGASSAASSHGDTTTVTASGGPSATTGGASANPTVSNGQTGTTGSVGAPPPPTTSPSNTPTTNTTTVLRNLVDPATLDELRRADAIDDVERQSRALRRAQTELENMAQELDRRANALDGRAQQLKQQK